MFIACLDLESTLIPEVWLAVADATKLDSLRITTREEPDVLALMEYRIKILRENNFKLKDFQEVVANLEPLDDAIVFYDWLKGQMPTLILTDALWPLIEPMMPKLGNPATLCHDLSVDKEGFIEEPILRLSDQKTKTIMKLQQLNYKTIAIGDSFNDLGMLRFADHGIIFNGSYEIKRAMPKMPTANTFTELKNEIISLG